MFRLSDDLPLPFVMSLRRGLYLHHTPAAGCWLRPPEFTSSALTTGLTFRLTGVSVMLLMFLFQVQSIKFSIQKQYSRTSCDHDSKHNFFIQPQFFTSLLLRCPPPSPHRHWSSLYPDISARTCECVNGSILFRLVGRYLPEFPLRWSGVAAQVVLSCRSDTSDGGSTTSDPIPSDPSLRLGSPETSRCR